MDLFAFAGQAVSTAPCRPQPVEPPTLPVPSLPAGSIAWQRILDRLATPALTLCVTSLYTGEALESASDPVMGFQILMRDGTVRPYPPNTAYGRTAYMAPSQAMELHKRHGLAVMGTPGSHGARFRFASDSSEATAAMAALLTRLAAATAS